MVENILFAKLMNMNCPQFDWSQCDFSPKSMVARDK
jgi:hypothetical protein